MNKLLLSSLLLSLVFFFTSCEDKEHMHEEKEFDYHAHIESPTVDDKKMGQDLDISIEFESHAGETVHHINVRITEKDSGKEIYNKPNNAHVHSDGSYKYEDTFTLNTDEGFTGHTDYILEAKVWGHEAGEGEEIETIEFHVHPE